MSMVSSYVVYKWCGVETGGEPSLHPGLGHAHEGLYRMFRARGLVFHSGESSSLSPIISALLGLSIMCVSVSCVSQTSLSKPEHIDMFLFQKVLGGLISEIFKSVH